VVIGTKSRQSKRRVPLPASLLHMLPYAGNRAAGHARRHRAKIEGSLFEGEDGSKRLNRLLKKLGIGTDPRKVVHSLRHRTKDRVRDAQCALDIQYELFGHEKVTVAAGYGKGHPLRNLVEWQAKIGWQSRVRLARSQVFARRSASSSLDSSVMFCTISNAITIG
jgi:hypothetical protein